MYIQFGNMPAHLRKLIRNHFVLGFVPFGGSFDDFIKPFINEMKTLEHGQIMQVQGQNVWVIAGLGVVTSDLPQGNDLVGVLRQNAIKGCRTCNINKDLFTNSDQDLGLTSRYHHLTDSEFSLISAETVFSRKKQLCSKYGLKLQKSILDQLSRERHLQTPQDVYHATAGKIAKLLNLTCELLSQDGELAFLQLWKTFEKPKQWGKLPNPISHRESFMMSDYLNLAMLMPFLLLRITKISNFKNNKIIAIRQQINASRNDLVLKSIVKCWVVVAQTMKFVFEKNFTEETYDKLSQLLDAERLILTKVRKLFYYNY